MKRVTLLLGLCLSSVASAQIAPSPAEIGDYSGLHAAVQAGDVVHLEELVATKTDLNQRDGNGRTAVHIAAFASHEAILRVLAKAGADMNALDNQVYDAVTIAAVANDPELMSVALELGNKATNVTSIYDGTALIAAAHLGHDEVVRRLIAAGAPLNHVNNLGWTALIEAVILGDGGPRHIATVKALVTAGADISLADRSGVTPLEHAQSRGYDDMAAIISPAQ